MKIKYSDLVDQTFDWPQKEFRLENEQLLFHGIPTMDLIEKYGSPLRISYLPKIGENIRRARKWFADAQKKHQYEGDYHYCYVTKSSHFRFVLAEAIKNGAHIETSSAFDLDIVRSLEKDGIMNKEHRILCNGFKREAYVERITSMAAEGFQNVLPVIDNEFELDLIEKNLTTKIDVGIRIASEEEPKFEFYTSRLGIGYRDIVDCYERRIKTNPNFSLKMLHFFVNTGINDNAYYWNELNKCMRVYCDLKKVCPELDSLNIGGGFPVKNSLAFNYDYEYMVDAILEQIKASCDEQGIPVPHIYTEFGSFTVGESGATLFKVVHQKKQNDKERWNLIDSSFMTTLPDSWSINKRFIMLPLNNWDDDYERVFLGGLTCDSDDYYNSEQHINAIYLPKYDKEDPLYIGFFNTGAYQDSLGGFGGVHHCLLPGPKHILIDRDDQGEIEIEVFAEEQTSEDMLTLLGYKKESK